MKFATLHPLVKLAIWFLSIGLLAILLQGCAWLVGVDFNILGTANGARAVLLTLAVVTFMGMMTADNCSLSEFGLFVGVKWKRIIFSGVGIGSAAYLAYMLPATYFGYFDWSTNDVSGLTLTKAGIASSSSFVVAATQQFLFSGYLLTMLRKRINRTVSVIMVGAMFAVLGRLSSSEGFLSYANVSLMIGLFAVATLLGLLRVKTGNILFPTGVLAGWLVLSRLNSKLHLFIPDPYTPGFQLVAPLADPRRAPIFWAAMATACVGVWVWLQLRGEKTYRSEGPALDADFKRLFPLSHSSLLVPLDVWGRVMVAARFRVGLPYIPRLITVLIFSTCNTLLTLPERIVVHMVARRKRVRPPVFILGIQRSGTTHLHNLMALDPQFRTPRYFHGTNPHGYCSTGWLLAPILMAMTPWKRPMDNVSTHLFAPQEEEFLLAGFSNASPFWGMTFPQYWPHFEQYIFPQRMSDQARSRWKATYLKVLQKLSLGSQKRLLLKNPYNTGRASVLHEMFSEAQFIHIVRHPYDVYRSNMHLADQGHVLNQLQNADPAISYQNRFLNNYRAIQDECTQSLAAIPSPQSIELRFEDLEQDPVGELKRLYQHLQLNWSDAFESRLHRYLERVQGYRKNRHQRLDPVTAAEIDSALGPMMIKHGYPMSSAGDLRHAG